MYVFNTPILIHVLLLLLLSSFFCFLPLQFLLSCFCLCFCFLQFLLFTLFSLLRSARSLIILGWALSSDESVTQNFSSVSSRFSLFSLPFFSSSLFSLDVTLFEAQCTAPFVPCLSRQAPAAFGEGSQSSGFVCL